MPHLTQRARGKRAARTLALAVAALLVPAGAAGAAVGPQNTSFENGLAGWTAEILHEGAHEALEVDDCEEPEHDPKRAICVLGTDTFTPDAGSPVTVTPLDGTKMARLGGPFTSEDQLQSMDNYRLRQTFTVDPADPVLDLNYHAFLFDDQGFDELRFTVADTNGAPIADFAQSSFAALGDTNLKSTGWRSASVDLSGYENEQVQLTVAAAGTNDQHYAFWAYVDAGEAPAPPVSAPSFKPATLPSSGVQVALNTFSDPMAGQTFVAASPGDAAAFPGGCMPLEVTVRIAGAVSEAYLLASFAKEFSMTEVAPGEWRAVITCVRSGELGVQYIVGGERFIVPVGGIALVDPAGVVYDQRRYDAAVAAGTPAAQARAEAAIEGATVRLQRQVGGAFRNVLAGDPDVTPHVNPEVTSANGQFQWLTGAGSYRVVVSKPGYLTAVSAAVTGASITGLHVGLTPTSAPPAPPTGGGGTGGGVPAAVVVPPPPPAAVVAPPAPPAKKAPCAGLRGVKLAKCKRAQKLAKAIAACKKGKASRGAPCIRRAKALARCEAMTGARNAAKRRRCVARARRIGAKP